MAAARGLPADPDDVARWTQCPPGDYPYAWHLLNDRGLGAAARRQLLSEMAPLYMAERSGYETAVLVDAFVDISSPARPAVAAGLRLLNRCGDGWAERFGDGVACAQMTDALSRVQRSDVPALCQAAVQHVAPSTRGYSVAQLIKTLNAVGRDEWDQQIQRTMQLRQPDVPVGADSIDLLTMVCSMNVRPRQTHRVPNTAPASGTHHSSEATTASPSAVGVQCRVRHSIVRRAERRAPSDRVLPVADFPVWLVGQVFERLPDADLASWMAVNSYYRILAGGILNRRPHRKPLSEGSASVRHASRQI